MGSGSIDSLIYAFRQSEGMGVKERVKEGVKEGVVSG